MTLLERLKALYIEDPDCHGDCAYCLKPLTDHDELCVWQTTQEAIEALEQHQGVLAVLTRAATIRETRVG